MQKQLKSVSDALSTQLKQSKFCDLLPIALRELFLFLSKTVFDRHKTPKALNHIEL